MITFVKIFKGRSVAFARQRGIVRNSFWQPRFYDHFLRGEETIETVTQYILLNPVRAGLVERWSKWRWSGSFVYDAATLRAVMGRGSSRDA